MDKQEEQVRAICEQGDLGLFETPLNEADQEAYKRQEEAEKKEETKA